MHLRTYAESGCAVIEVRDRGEGMTEAFVREHLFRPFRTTKPTGMGVGAYESQQYVAELGGRISVDSVPGMGTTVRVHLPQGGRAQLQQAAA